MTKHEILYSQPDIDNQFDYYEPSVLKAMDVYAKQEAIEFAKWYFKTNWAIIEDGKGMYMNIESEETKSIDDIYNMYLLSKQQQ